MDKEFKYYFSFVTGRVEKILADEVGILDSYQLPLKKKPTSSCRKCYGRGYKHFDKFNQTFIPCKCVKKVMDTEITKDMEISFYNPK